MIPADLQAELDRLAATLLPEFAPLYWLDTAELPQNRKLPAWGYTGRGLDASVREVIGDRWQGRRPCIVLDLECIEHETRDDAYFSPELLALAVRGHILGIAIHELGHVADDGIDQRPLTTQLSGFADMAHELSVAFYTADADLKDGKPPWYLHSAGWLRCTAHAAHRARQAGFHFPDTAVWNRLNSVCPLLHTATANLETELHELAHVPLSKLNTYAPPTDYRGLWRCKTSRWRSTRPAIDTEADRHVAAALSYFKG